MPVETFSYLDSLVATNPVTSEGIVNGDDHIRGIKSTLLATFPNISGAVTATHTELNTVVGGASVLNDSGAFFKTSGDGFANTLSGDIDVKLQGVLAATFQRTGGANFFKSFGGIEATGEIKGPGITPIGAAVMWFDDTLPSDGLWAWANGQVIASANTVCPILLARWGSRFGGNGTTTMGVPNMQEVVPVGKSQMGGAAEPGLLGSVAWGVKNVIGALFGSQTNTIARANLPNVAPTFTGLNTSVSVLTTNTDILRGSIKDPVQGTQAGSSFYMTSLVSNGVAAQQQQSTGTIVPLGSVQSLNGGVAQTSVNNLQPSRVVNWIIRLG